MLKRNNHSNSVNKRASHSLNRSGVGAAFHEDARVRTTGVAKASHEFKPAFFRVIHQNDALIRLLRTFCLHYPLRGLWLICVPGIPTNIDRYPAHERTFIIYEGMVCLKGL